MRRFAVEEEYGPPASPFESPKSGELKFPIGCARFTSLKMFRAATASVTLYLYPELSNPNPPR